MEVDYSIYYSKWHNDTDECYRNNSIWYQCLLRPVLNNTPETANILDVGCGTGLLVNMLKDAGFPMFEVLTLVCIKLQRPLGEDCHAKLSKTNIYSAWLIVNLRLMT